MKGEQITLDNIKRNDSGAFLCIARSKIPPAVSQRIKLDVNCRCIRVDFVERKEVISAAFF